MCHQLWWDCENIVQTMSAFISYFLFWRKNFSLVLILVPGLVLNLNKNTKWIHRRVSHSCWSVWGLLSFDSSCCLSAGTEDMMTNLGRDVERRGELTSGSEGAGFIPSRFLITVVCSGRLAIQAVAGIAFITHWLCLSPDLAEKEGNSLCFQSLAFILRLLTSFASWKSEIILFHMWHARMALPFCHQWPYFTILCSCVSYWMKATADCLLEDVDVILTALAYACFARLFVFGAVGHKK